MRKYIDIEGVSTEHMVSERLHAAGQPAGLVKLSAQLEGGQFGLCQLTPAQAREIGVHLFEAAARAEYEGDVLLAVARKGVDDTIGTLIATLAREGEMRRHVRFRGGS